MNHDEMLQMRLVEHPCYVATFPGDVMRQGLELHIVVGKVTREQKGDGYNLYELRLDKATWVTFGAVRTDFVVDVDDIIVVKVT